MWFRVCGLVFRVCVLGFVVCGLGFVHTKNIIFDKNLFSPLLMLKLITSLTSNFRVYGLWFRVCGLWFRVCGLWFVV